MYQFGVVTEVRGLTGTMNLMEFREGKPVCTGKISFPVNIGQFFTMGRRQPKLSGSRYKKDLVGQDLRKLPRPKVGHTLLFKTKEVLPGLISVTAWGYYKDWRVLRDRMKRKRQTNRINQVKIGFEKLVTAPVK